MLKLLCFHGLIRFKIEEAKLYSLKQIIVFYNSPAFAAIIYDYTITVSYTHLNKTFSSYSVPNAAMWELKIARKYNRILATIPASASQP